jgi:two-component system response regulator NreC
LKKPAKVLLADDHAIVRRGIRLILSQYPEEFDVVGEAGSGEETLQLVGRLHPDVVVLDISMPLLNGIEVARRAKQDYPEVRILILSMHKDSIYVRESLKAGAKGYLLKEGVDTELIKALRELARDNGYITPSVSNTVLSDYQRFVSNPWDLLTAREYEIFKLLADGMTAKEIAAQLNISVYTVDAHRNRILRKLQLKSGSELIRFAIKNGVAN